MSLRLAKIVLLANAFAYLALVVFNNLDDYGSNYQFVRHVLSMDTTFPGNAGLWRAIVSPGAFRLFYAGIIGWEALTGTLIAAGAWRLWRVRAGGVADWERAKRLATAGLALGMTQWYFAFIVIGGEWFLMWQSTIWNGIDAAFRNFAMFGIILIFICLPEPAA